MKAIIVMPTYNEAENLPLMVSALLSLPLGGIHVLVVDDNSPDGTGEVAERLAQEHPGRVEVLHRSRKLGLGSAYIAGFRRALEMGAEAILEMDADFSHPPQCVPLLLEHLGEYDVAVGSRYVSGGTVDPHWSLGRKLLSWGGNRYARVVTGLRVKDVTAGFKAFRKEVLTSLDLSRLRSDGYAFQVEMAYLCEKRGFRIKEVPITFGERSAGKSKMSGKIVWEALWRVWQMRWRY